MLSRNSLLFACCLLFALHISSCKKENTNIDATLYNEIKSVGGFIYYKGDNTVLQSSTASAHTPYFRVRYNSTAYAALTDNGKLPVGATFPDGSVVVKELYTSLTGELCTRLKRHTHK
jgi:hypothetical protein